MPVRMILSCDLQFGSGQAINASVDIQSFECVLRCLAASRGRTEAFVRNDQHCGQFSNLLWGQLRTKAVYTDTLPQWQVQHFAL